MQTISFILRILGSFVVSITIVNLWTYILNAGKYTLLRGGLSDISSLICGVLTGLLVVGLMWLSQD